MLACLGLALAAASLPPTAEAASISCSKERESRQPVLLVHGFNSGPHTWSTESREQLARAGAGTCIEVFDYSDRATFWVTDPAIGPALARTIGALARASRAGNGSGKVILVAHSMGGLASRCAVFSTCNGGLDTTRSEVAALITFGTPHLGSWLLDEQRGVASSSVASVLSAACYLNTPAMRSGLAEAACDQIRAFGTSDAAHAFRPDSTELTSLPRWPGNIPVFALAAKVVLHSSYFGVNDVTLGDAGDLIVLQPSAQAVANKREGIGGQQTIDCGTIDITSWFSSTSSCWHSSETNDTRFLQAAAHQITLTAKSLGLALFPLTTAQVLDATVPAWSCGERDGDYGWDQPVPIKLRKGAGSARTSDGSFAGASIDTTRILGYADVDGDGRREVALQYDCFGSLPENCCAGQASKLSFVSVFAASGDGRLTRVGQVIHGGKSLPGDESGPASRGIESATLKGTTITTKEYVLYAHTFTAEQVGGDPNASVLVRYTFANGKWTSR